MKLEVPVVTTARLQLVGHAQTDFADCCALWTDPLVTRFIGGRPFVVEEIWTRLLRYVGHWAVLGYGYWVIRERATGAFCGEVGFADFHRQIEPPIVTPEIGWALRPAYWRNGYASEAVQAVVQWGDAHFGEQKTVCLIDPDNLASKKVAEKCGYREKTPTHYKGVPTVLFERPPRGGLTSAP